jgi:hypothetical protein
LTIAGEKHMSSLGFALCAVIGTIQIKVSYTAIIDGNGNVIADAIAVQM